MSRPAIALSALGVVLVAVLFYFLVWSPANDRIAELDAQREAVEAQIVSLRARIARLEDLRGEAPELEDEIVAADAIVPQDLALPGAFRQLQLAADEAGLRLVQVAPARAETLEGGTPGLVLIPLNVQVSGEYFALIDFLRRLEDPAISPRGIRWSSLSVSAGEYPILTLSATGSMFAEVTEAAPVPEPAPSPPAGDGGDGGDGGATPAPTVTTTPTETPS